MIPEPEYTVVDEIISLEEVPNFCQKLFMLLKFGGSALSISSSIFGNVLLYTAGFVTLNLVDEGVEQAAFGICASYLNMFVTAIMLSSLDKYGIDLSVFFGNKQYDKMRTITSKAILTISSIMIFFSFPMMYFSRPILIKIGIKENVAEISSNAIIHLIGMAVIKITAEMVKTFCIAQGHESVFAVPGYLNTISTLYMIYYLVVTHQMKILGWIYSKYANELVNLLIAVVVMYCKTERASRGLNSWMKTKRRFCRYYFETIKYMMGSYTEYLAYEITTYFVALTEDIDQVAAYSCIYNVNEFIYCLGISLALVCRTRASILIGMDRQETGKQFFREFYRFAVFVGVLMGIATYFLRSYIADIYASNDPEQKEILMNLLTMFCIFMPSEAALMTSTITMKTIGKVKVLLLLNCILLIGLNSGGATFIHKTKPHVQNYLLCIICANLLLNISGYFVSVLSKWPTAYESINIRTSSNVKISIMDDNIRTIKERLVRSGIKNDDDETND